MDLPIRKLTPYEAGAQARRSGLGLGHIPHLLCSDRREYVKGWRETSSRMMHEELQELRSRTT